MDREMIYRCLCLLVAVALLSISGCKSGPKTELKKIPFDLPQGWRKADRPAQGFSIGVPGEWISLNALLAEAEAKAQERAATPSTPGDSSDVAKQLEQFSLAMGADQIEALKSRIAAKEAKGVFVYCVSRGVRQVIGEKETHFSVEKKTVGGNAQLKDLGEDIHKEVNGAGAVEGIELPVGKAVKVSGQQTLVDGGVVSSIVYGLVNGGDEYIIRFVTEEQALDLKRIADPIVQTFRVN